MRNWEIAQIDFKSAFLQATLEEEIYMRQPKGYDDGSGQVCRLHKSLYGLKQASRAWNKKLHTGLVTLHFRQTNSDHAVYVRQSSDGHVILAIHVIHVDNPLVIAITPDMIQCVRQELGLSFEITDEDPTWFLGCHIIRDHDARTITILHRLYTGTLGKRFRLEDAYPVTTPLDPSEHLSTDDGPKTDEERHEMASRPYRELVGGLLAACSG